MYRVVQGEYKKAIKLAHEELASEFGDSIEIPSLRPHVVIFDNKVFTRALVGNLNESSAEYRKDVRNEVIFALKPELYTEPVNEKLAKLSIDVESGWIKLFFEQDQESIVYSEYIMANKALRNASPEDTIQLEEPAIHIAQVLERTASLDALTQVKLRIAESAMTDIVTLGAPISNINNKKPKKS